MLYTFLVFFTYIGQLIAEDDISSRIYHGSSAYKGQFPFMARTLLAHQFTNVTHSYTFCGGSLITDRWVVSAAHCAVGAVSVDITLGMTNTNDNSGTLTYKVRKSGIFIHPDYAPNKSPSPDIVLYKLPSTVPLKDHPNIKTVRLPSVEPDSVSSYDGSLVTVVGWGQTESGEGSADLKYATVKVMNNSECIQKFPPGATKATICTEQRYNNAAPCGGDSGGPLLANGRNGLELVGITSFGVGAPPCSDPNGGSVFTYQPYYSRWILRTIIYN